MTLDEAIKHTTEVAKDKENIASFLWNTKEKARLEDDASEYRQLAEWLKELKEYKDKNEPKLVIYLCDGYWAECPNCSFTFEDDDADWEMPYCPSCGQALKWEMEE